MLLLKVGSLTPGRVPVQWLVLFCRWCHWSYLFCDSYSSCYYGELLQVLLKRIL